MTKKSVYDIQVSHLIVMLISLGVAQSFSETGPSLWTVLSTAAGGIKVPLPTKNEYVDA
jgi:hypothetical protein